MPPPGELEAYERVLPGSAERIMRAYESVTTDASARDDRLTDAQVWTRKNGAGWAYFFLFGSILAAVLFFAFGNNFAGACFLGAPLITGMASIVTTAMKRD